MTRRQALALAEMALDHVACCIDDEDRDFETARRIILLWLRRKRCTTPQKR